MLRFLTRHLSPEKTEIAPVPEAPGTPGSGDPVPLREGPSGARPAASSGGIDLLQGFLRRLAGTSTFRLAMLYMLLFSLSVLMLLAFIYDNTVGFIDRQVDATIDAEITGLAEQYRQRGLPGLVRIIAERSQASAGKDYDQSVYLLLDAQGNRLAGNLDRWPDAEDSRVQYDGRWLRFPLRDASEKTEDAGRKSRPARAATFLLNGGFRLLVGRDMQERQQFQRLIEESLFWAVLMTLGMGLVGGLVISRNMLRRVDVINRTSQHIVAGRLDQRIPMKGNGDEFDHLAENLNRMLDQIERLMEGMRAVTDNVAHDLRGPLNRMKSRLEVTLISERDPDVLRAALEDTIAEADSLLATFNALLSIARLESGAQHPDFAPVDLALLAQDAAELYEPLFEEAGLVLRVNVVETAMVAGDRHLLAQAIANLLDNAVKHGNPGSPVDAAGDGPGDADREVELTVSRSAGRGGKAGREQQVSLMVADHGPGIAPGDRHKVLQRYFRLEQSRSTVGNGLGLSLVNAVVELHGGNLQMRATRLSGRGLTIEMNLPGHSGPALSGEERAENREDS